MIIGATCMAEIDLLTKLDGIGKPIVIEYVPVSCDSIEDFWEKFVKERLPKPDVVFKWNNLLKRYVEEEDCVFAIRAFGNWESKKQDYEKNKNEALRRGFLTHTNINCSFFYTDNYFAAYFMKMALDGYVPKYDDFYNAMLTRKFPARFGRYDSEFEAKRAAYSLQGKDPGLNKGGYKLAHIVNVGKDYCYDNKRFTIGEICNNFFPRGDYNQWTLMSDAYGEYYARKLQIKSETSHEARTFLKAHFLRFTSPMNYILTPKKSLHKTAVKVNGNDIAESIELQTYAMKKLRDIYGECYDQYLEDILYVEHKTNKYLGIEMLPLK